METSKILFESLFIDILPYDIICTEMKISRKDLSAYYAEFNSNRKGEIKEVRRVRQLYNNKINLDKKNGLKEFKFLSFKDFYYWHKKQYEKQNGECYYCHTSESIIRTLFTKSIIASARQSNRGQHMEIERKDGKNKLYNSQNCVLACYFCNNDKSDIFSEQEYLLYLQDRKAFFMNKCNNQLND